MTLAPAYRLLRIENREAFVEVLKTWAKLMDQGKVSCRFAAAEFRVSFEELYEEFQQEGIECEALQGFIQEHQQ